MGKKGSWFSAIKRAFTPHSKEKQLSNNVCFLLWIHKTEMMINWWLKCIPFGVFGFMVWQQEPESKSNKEKKKKGFGKKLKNGENNSFLPSFRQPSSIEKILGEAEREHRIVFRPPTPTGLAKPSTTSAPSSLVRPASPKVSSQRYVSSPRPISPRIASSRPPSPKPPSPRIVQRREFVHRPEPTLPIKKGSAIKIQAAFRGYMVIK